MRLQLFSSGVKSGHRGFASAVTWVSAESFVTSGDDRRLLFWNTSVRSHEAVKAIQLPPDAVPVSMDFPLQSANLTANDTGSLTIAIGTTTGRVYLFPVSPTSSQQQQQMKKFDAHKGSVIAVRWSPDQSTLVTCGEDGTVKVWSKTGMLRTTLFQSDFAVYCIAWSADSNSVVFGSGIGLLTVKSLSSQSRSSEWPAHEGLVVDVDWSLQRKDSILSAGEDGRVMLWDANGTLLFATKANQSSVPSCVRWSPDGQYFAVASFLSVKIYHSSGTLATTEKLSFEGVFRLSWSPDSNQLALVCANGIVMNGFLSEQTLDVAVWSIANSSRKTVSVRNFLTDVNATLDLPSAMTRMSFAFEHLVVATTGQCLVFKTTNWTSPVSIDVRSLDLVLLIVQSGRHFMLVGSNFNVLVCEYSGRTVKSVRLNNMRLGAVQPSSISLNAHFIAYKDAVNVSTVNFVPLSSKGSRVGCYRHSLEVTTVRLSPDCRETEQTVAFVDVNQDLYILLWKCSENSFQVYKLSSMIFDFIWHCEYALIVALSENQTLLVWTYPNVAFVDASLLQEVQIPVALDSHVSKAARLSEFVLDQVTLQKADRVRLHITVNSFLVLLHRLRRDARWNDALKTCNILEQSSSSSSREIGLNTAPNSAGGRSIERTIVRSLWATLAVMSLEARQFDIATIAYAAIDKIEKVIHLNAVKGLSQSDVQTLELELIRSNVDTAESGFLQKGYLLRAVMLNLTLFRWTKALSLAQKFDARFKPIALPDKESLSLVTIVLSKRQSHLTAKRRDESSAEFLEAMREIEDIPDWSEIEEIVKRNMYIKS